MMFWLGTDYQGLWNRAQRKGLRWELYGRVNCTVVYFLRACPGNISH